MSILGQIEECLYNGCGNFFNYALFLVILLVLSYIYFIGIVMQKIYSWILCSIELLKFEVCIATNSIKRNSENSFNV